MEPSQTLVFITVVLVLALIAMLWRVLDAVLEDKQRPRGRRRR